ncbi:hypothetical protein F4604DRAFT_1660333 [Suillus subluteus]|nr:hypothetical protein F4604DRAFT_1660333 [Suillus subluteus]
MYLAKKQVHSPPPPISQPRPLKHKRVKLRVQDSDDEIPIEQPPLLPPLTPEYEFYCRCGSRQHGDLQKESEMAIQCDNCERWSHIACQRDGQASTLAKKEPFYCDTADSVPPHKSSYGETFVVGFPGYTSVSMNLSTMIRPGKGALARHGKYWYPVRIKSRQQVGGKALFTVKWWRHCSFKPDTQPPVEVGEEDLVDALYGDCKRRRMIRLGRWIHAHEVPQHEDIIANYKNIPYSVNIDEALTPHSQLLTDILEQPDPVRMCNAVPVLGYLADLSAKTGCKHTTVPYCGDLSLTDCAQIANWIYHRIPGASKQIINWLNCATYAHACTIVVAKRKKNQLQELAENMLTEPNAILEAAWLDLQVSYDLSSMDIDVDLECLGILEQQMFKLSLAAGAAGNEQWGKDTGAHQDRWNPYEGLPEYWNHGDRDPYAPEFEGELDVRDLDVLWRGALTPNSVGRTLVKEVSPKSLRKRNISRSPNHGHVQGRYTRVRVHKLPILSSYCEMNTRLVW